MRPLNSLRRLNMSVVRGEPCGDICTRVAFAKRPLLLASGAQLVQCSRQAECSHLVGMPAWLPAAAGMSMQAAAQHALTGWVGVDVPFVLGM